MRSKRCTVEIDGKMFHLTNLDKPFWPGDGLTKADLIEYYLKVSGFVLPHLRSRPLVLTRYPNGIEGKGFYQKNTPPNSPEWLQTVTLDTAERPIRFALAENEADLAYLANLGAIEIHPWLSRKESPDYPDFIVFDLDPAPPATFEDCRVVAVAVRELLARFGLVGFPKTSGATGLHIYVPVRPIYTYEQTRGFVQFLANLILRAAPSKVTLERMVDKRAGKVYIDYLQNVKGKTIVAPYSPRPLPGAPVSTPVSWEELEQISPLDFSILTVPNRLKSRGDLFRETLSTKQSIDDVFGFIRQLEDSSRRGRTHSSFGDLYSPLDQAPTVP